MRKRESVLLPQEWLRWSDAVIVSTVLGYRVCQSSDCNLVVSLLSPSSLQLELFTILNN